MVPSSPPQLVRMRKKSSVELELANQRCRCAATTSEYQWLLWLHDVAAVLGPRDRAASRRLSHATARLAARERPEARRSRNELEKYDASRARLRRKSGGKPETPTKEKRKAKPAFTALGTQRDSRRTGVGEGEAFSFMREYLDLRATHPLRQRSIIFHFGVFDFPW